jgi:hypothetical protein
MNTIKLGSKVRDKITGFEGIVTSHVRYLTGCDQHGVTPEAKDGKIQESEYFDYKRLETIGEGINIEDVSVKGNPGGINRDAPRR